ncbi:hypothetical protein, partial [Orbus sasakiae]|uniref:glycoside hydrolase family 19 protein n=1 Tax=Orbus sasakiae TaxID=1078475 RepID=UPI0031ECBBE4
DHFYQTACENKRQRILAELDECHITKPAEREYPLKLLNAQYQSHIDTWQIEKAQRIKPSLWWDEVAKAQASQTDNTDTATTDNTPVLSNLSLDGKAWYFHPVGIKMFESKKCFCERDFTIEDLIEIGISESKAIEYIDTINQTLNQYSINTCIRKLHFLAQVRHESGDFYYKEEIASGRSYEGRKDLGNIQKGDGVKFKGRGFIQITGRKNYENYGSYININFTEGSNNVLLANLPYCIDSAGWYWQKYINIDLNTIADKNDLIYISYRINGGFNGFNDRKMKLISMMDKFECNNINYESLYSIFTSRCFDLHDAVFKYANLNTTESKECYSKYLSLTENYLSWSSINGWESDIVKKKNKEKIDKRRLIATKGVE